MDFDVEDDATSIVAEVTGTNGAGDLDDTNNVVKQTAVVSLLHQLVFQVKAIRQSNYVDSASEFDVADSPAMSSLQRLYKYFWY